MASVSRYLSAMLVGLAVLVAMSGCGGAGGRSASPTRDTHDPAADACAKATSAARNLVDGAISRHRACVEDSDCLVIEVATKCFDRCTTAINRAGLLEVRAAIGAADVRYCDAFEQARCPRIVPPCLAPQPSKCVHQVCSS